MKTLTVVQDEDAHEALYDHNGTLVHYEDTIFVCDIHALAQGKPFILKFEQLDRVVHEWPDKLDDVFEFQLRS